MVFSGCDLVKGKVSNRGRGLGDGRLAERIGLKAVAAGELDEVDQMAFQLRKRQLNPPRGRRQATPTTLLADQERGDGRQAQNRPVREQADERALGQLEQGVHQHKQHEHRQRDRGGQDGSAPERKRPPLEPGLPQPRGHNFCLGRHDWRFLIRWGGLPLGIGASSRARRTLHRPLHQCVTAMTMTLVPMASASLSLLAVGVGVRELLPAVAQVEPAVDDSEPSVERDSRQAGGAVAPKSSDTRSRTARRSKAPSRGSYTSGPIRPPSPSVISSTSETRAIREPTSSPWSTSARSSSAPRHSRKASARRPGRQAGRRQPRAGKDGAEPSRPS